MKFKTVFTGGKKYAISLPKEGSLLYQTVQKKFGPIDPELIYVNSGQIDVSIIVTGEDAIKSGRFVTDNTIHIGVPEGALNWATKWDAVKGSDGIIQLSIVIDRVSIIESWFSAKCPLTWDGKQMIHSVEKLQKKINSLIKKRDRLLNVRQYTPAYL